MKKTSIAIILIILIVFLFIFQNLYTWFNHVGKIDLTQISDPAGMQANFQQMRKLFSTLSLVTALFILGTGIYLAFQFRKAKPGQIIEAIPPLHNYLLELKGSETELKDLVQKQQNHVVEKEELNKSIINNIDAAVIFLNRSRRIDIFNSVAQQLFSQSFANAKNNLPEIVFSAFPGILQFLTANENSKNSAEVSVGERFFWVNLNPIENIGQLLLIRDITEEKRREEMERRNGNFIMLGEMAAFLAHEVRNSLGVIYGYTKTIKADSEKTKTEKINKEINFLTDMMENFLNFSRPVKITQTIAINLFALFETVAAESGLLLQQPSTAAIYLETDPALLHSVFSNLFLNAKQAGADRVEVQVEQSPDKALSITLKDNGKGIADEIKEKIWFPFFTTKDKGSGMGLAIIRKILSTLKGDISLIESCPTGTTFRIDFFA